jgi:hypothetical protein
MPRPLSEVGRAAPVCLREQLGVNGHQEGSPHWWPRAVVLVRIWWCDRQSLGKEDEM